MTRGPQFTAGQARLTLLAIWGMVCAFLIANNWDMIVHMYFRDPDDALRLVQVRDLLGGQSWFNVTQHRLHPPTGVPMHWSRIVDAPIALVIAALKPQVGQALAERAALVIVPLGELLVLFGVVFKLSRSLGLQRSTALGATALLGTSVSILIQFYPNRIDHHGIQMIFGGLATIALVSSAPRNGLMGLLAGLAMAAWLQVSMEGLPCAVAMGALFGLRSVWRVDERRDIATYLSALTGGSAALLLATHRPLDALLFWCDAMSPAYLLPLAATTGTLLLALRSLPGRTMAERLTPLVLAGAAGGVSYLAFSHQCLAGPFSSVDPLVYATWYRSVLEGMPITAQKPEMQALIVLPVLLGLPGTVMGLRAAANDKHRAGWRNLLFMQVAAALLALDVMRAMSFAHLLSLPGNAVLLAAMMRRAQSLRLMPPRVILSVATAILTPFGAVAATAAAIVNEASPVQDSQAKRDEETAVRCTRYETTRGLDALPATTLFTPLDIGAHLLAYTHHSVVATGHHRNIQGMNEVVTAFLAAPDQARPIVMASPARYLAICTTYTEVQRYKRLWPHSLTADLIAGRTPSWLEPVPMRPGETIRVYRILRPEPAATT